MDVVPRQSHVTSTQTPPTTLVNTGRLTNSILKTLTWRCAGCGSIFMVFLILSHTTLAFNIHSDKCYSSVSFYECNLWIHIWVDIKWWWSCTGSHRHGQSQLLVDITLLKELTELLKTDLAILILVHWHDGPVHQLLQLLLLEVAANHGLQNLNILINYYNY